LEVILPLFGSFPYPNPFASLQTRESKHQCEWLRIERPAGTVKTNSCKKRKCFESFLGIFYSGGNWTDDPDLFLAVTAGSEERIRMTNAINLICSIAEECKCNKKSTGLMPGIVKGKSTLINHYVLIISTPYIVHSSQPLVPPSTTKPI